MTAKKKKTAAARKGEGPSASLRMAYLVAAREFVATHLPGAEVNAKFGGASFFVEGKVFAFSRPKGLVLKLPPDEIAEVLGARDAGHLQMGKRVMREWVLLGQVSQEAYQHELPLLRSAMDYVRSLPKKKKRS